MSKFTRPLIVSPLPDGLRWVLREKFSYDIGHKKSNQSILIPEGFVTDFASIPRAFWTFYPKWGKYGNAAVVHDYLYWEQFFSRDRSDEIFLEAMRVLNVEDHDCKIIYNSVRFFGGKSWKENKKKKSSGENRMIDLTN